MSAMARRQRLIDRRDELGLTQDGVARAAGLTENTIRRYELGLSTPRGGDKRAYAAALDWTPAQLSLAFADEPPAVNGHSVPGWLGHLASLEQAAARLCAFEATTVHGLLQTADYALAVERTDAVPKSEDGIARRVETRLARQAVLSREPDPLELSVILDESVLRRVAGGRRVMADQLDHLATVAEWPNVDLRVLPLDSEIFVFGSFALLTHQRASAPYMAIIEDRAGPHYLDRPHELEAHGVLWAHLSAAALAPAETVDLIRSVAKETTT